MTEQIIPQEQLTNPKIEKQQDSEINHVKTIKYSSPNLKF